MTIAVQYNKGKVIQALRYHFLSKMEIKMLLILVNVFALLAAVLLSMKLIRPAPFLVSSFLWFLLMITFWFVLPWLVYKRSDTFKEKIAVTFYEKDMLLATEKGNTHWQYRKFQYYLETPHFFHLYINERSFFLIPKDACAEIGTEVVRHLLDNKIGKK